MRILFVCLGNICRSPTAEGVVRHKLREAGLGDDVDVESAGTGGWHVGHPPDPRASAAAAARGIALDSRAQRFEAFHFEDFDLILAMDRQNLADMRTLAPHAAAEGKLHLFREFDPARGRVRRSRGSRSVLRRRGRLRRGARHGRPRRDGLIAEIRATMAAGG